eukprot:6213409-Pleurochrysis_carterae.AAC.1
METMFHMGLPPYLDVEIGDHGLYGAPPHMLEVVLEVVVSATASRACSCGIIVQGWTMSYKWGHPVATLPVTNGTIRHIRRVTEMLRSVPAQLYLNARNMHAYALYVSLEHCHSESAFMLTGTTGVAILRGPIKNGPLCAKEESVTCKKMLMDCESVRLGLCT